MAMDYSGNPIEGFTGPVDDLTLDVNDEIRAWIKGEIEPGERLLWTGRSSPSPQPPGFGSYFAGGVVLLGLTFGVITIAYAFGGPSGPLNESSMVFGPLGLIVGFFFSILWFLDLKNRRAEQKRAARVCYAVTERRAILWHPVTNSDAIRVHTIPAGQITNIIRVQRPDGSGDLEFSCSGEIHYHFNPRSFRSIPEVRRVEQIIRNNLMKNVKAPRVERERSESLGEVTW